MPERHKDWLRQARHDLEFAMVAAREQHFEWAAFVALQAAEKACKALHLYLGKMASAHELTLLLEQLPPTHQPQPDLLKRAKALERHYMATRYPTMFASGTPRENYTKKEGEQAIADAMAVLEFCQHTIGTPLTP
jgi:HEPN domain-containing protein